VADFGLAATVLPDYSDTLDAPAWAEYQQISAGGTPLEAIGRMGGARATIECGAAWDTNATAGKLLEERCGVPRHDLPMPIGVNLSDRLAEKLVQLSGRALPGQHCGERGRLIDCYVDAHKHVFDKKAVLFGEQDLVIGLASLLAEVGMVPALCASGARTGRFRERVLEVAADLADRITVLEGVDFAAIEEHAERIRPDLLIGNSKGYKLSRKLGVPLVRVGFPIHDRIDGPRLLHIGYRGAQQLFDRIANALIGVEQDASPVGYTYM
jgi:nitrogenase molybdenum-iron protein NifN